MCVISAITQRTWLHSFAFFFHTMWPQSSPPPTLARYLDISRCLLALITAKMHFTFEVDFIANCIFFSLHFVLHILRQLHNRTMDGRVRDNNSTKQGKWEQRDAKGSAQNWGFSWILHIVHINADGCQCTAQFFFIFCLALKTKTCENV